MGQSKLLKELSIVAVPIGHVDDFTQRSKDALQAAELIFCEDTRKSKDLFKRANLSIKAKLVPLPGSSEHEVDWDKYFSLEHSKFVLISDAGTPIVNDPGKSASDYCRAHQIDVKCIPGVSAPLAAWQWGGGFGLPFTFLGFVPKTSSSELLSTFFSTNKPGTLCFFDTKHQVMNTLHFLKDTYPDLSLYITREMTKDHEQILHGSIFEVFDKMNALVDGAKVGELTIVVDAAGLSKSDMANSQISIEDIIEFKNMSVKSASKFLAKYYQGSASDFYKRLCDADK